MYWTLNEIMFFRSHSYADNGRKITIQDYDNKDKASGAILGVYGSVHPKGTTTRSLQGSRIKSTA